MMKKVLKNLGVWILVAMVAGVAVGVAMGDEAKIFAPLGTLFIQLIKMLVVPLVGISIISGAASLGSSRSAGKIGVTSILYIVLTTVVSIVIAIVVGLIFKPGSGLSAEGIASIMASASTEQGAPTDLSFWDTIIGMIPTNPIQALANGNILNMTPVTVVGLLDQPGSLANLLDIFTAGGIDIEYMYSLFTHMEGKAYMVFRVSDEAKFKALLDGHGIQTCGAEELGLKQ